jgi:hypothetical protein
VHLQERGQAGRHAPKKPTGMYLLHPLYWTANPWSHHIRPYYPDSTVSRPICEVKQGQVGLVLAWGTSWEVPMLYIFLPSSYSQPFALSQRFATNVSQPTLSLFVAFLLFVLFFALFFGMLFFLLVPWLGPCMLPPPPGRAPRWRLAGAAIFVKKKKTGT